MWLQFDYKPNTLLGKCSWFWKQFCCSGISRVCVRVKFMWHWVLCVHGHGLHNTSGWLSYDCTGSLWYLWISVNIRWQGVFYFNQHCLLHTLLTMMWLQFECRPNRILQKYSWSWPQSYCSKISRVRVRVRQHGVLCVHWHCLLHTPGWDWCDLTVSLWHLSIYDYIRWRWVLILTNTVVSTHVAAVCIQTQLFDGVVSLIMTAILLLEVI